MTYQPAKAWDNPLTCILKEHLARFKYKPNWHFSAHNIGGLGSGITAMMDVIDVQTGKPTQVGFTECVSSMLFDPLRNEPMHEPEIFMSLMRKIILTMETHEAEEWITYDGHKPFDPHKGDFIPPNPNYPDLRL